jgi:hypothetical protein
MPRLRCSKEVLLTSDRVLRARLLYPYRGGLDSEGCRER